MDFPSEELLPTVSLSSGSLLHPACISSVLLVIHSLGHHRPFLQYSKGHHHVSSFSFCYCFWWNFSFEAPEALDLPISAAAASVVTLVALLACTGSSTIVSFSSYIWSLFVSWELVLIQIILSPLASSSHICNCCCCCCCCGNFFKLPKLSPETWQCHWESCEAKKTSYPERIFHTLCEAEMIQTLWSSLWFAIW